MKPARSTLIRKAHICADYGETTAHDIHDHNKNEGGRGSTDDRRHEQVGRPCRNAKLCLIILRANMEYPAPPAPPHDLAPPGPPNITRCITTHLHASNFGYAKGNAVLENDGGQARSGRFFLITRKKTYSKREKGNRGGRFSPHFLSSRWCPGQRLLNQATAVAMARHPSARRRPISSSNPRRIPSAMRQLRRDAIDDLAMPAQRVPTPPSRTIQLICSPPVHFQGSKIWSPDMARRRLLR